ALRRIAERDVDIPDGDEGDPFRGSARRLRGAARKLAVRPSELRMRIIGRERPDLPAERRRVEAAGAGWVRRHELMPDEASALTVVGHPPSPMFVRASRRSGAHRAPIRAAEEGAFP